ncbi:MAG TPA: hypothetical protein VL738_41260 [Dactylosporangium sp.]|nr:hypothetical protein [Dactylosporangium sp.]
MTTPDIPPSPDGGATPPPGPVDDSTAADGPAQSDHAAPDGATAVHATADEATAAQAAAADEAIEHAPSEQAASELGWSEQGASERAASAGETIEQVAFQEAAPEPEKAENGADDAWPESLPPDSGAPPSRPRRRLAVTLTAAGVVLAVLAGGAAYAMKRLWDEPTGTLPEDMVPASAAAFARVNLSPGLGQRVKFEELLRKTRGGAGKQLDDVKRDLFKDLRAPVAYEDVAPWFDDRLGVALWAAPAQPGRAVTLIVASAKDAGKARTTLDAAQRRRGTDKLGFVVAGGYALVAVSDDGSQAAADAAAAEAKKSPLSRDAGFRSAIATLPADQPAIGWADLAKANRLTPQLQEAYEARLAQDSPLGVLGGSGELVPFGDLGELAYGPTPSGAPTSSTAAPSGPVLDVKGVAVLGVQAGDDGLDARLRLIGFEGLPLGTDAAPSDVLSALGTLSGDASAAGVAAGPLGDLGAALGPNAGYLPLSLFGALDFRSLAAPEDMPAFTGDPDEIEKYLQEHPELFENDNGDGTFSIRTVVPLGGVVDPDAIATTLTSALGSAKAVSFTVAGKADEASMELPVQLDLRMADAAAAKQLAQSLAELAKISKAKVEQHEDHVVLRSGAYVGGASHLADSALFQRAMAGGVAHPGVAVYVGGGAMAGGPVQAVGVTAGREGADAVLHARFVIG